MYFNVKMPAFNRLFGKIQIWQGYSSTLRMSTAMILGLPALVLLLGPAIDSSQRSIKSSAEILGDTSAFRSHSARGSRDYKGKKVTGDHMKEKKSVMWQ